MRRSRSSRPVLPSCSKNVRQGDDRSCACAACAMAFAVADAAGAHGVVMSNDSVDLFNPKVVRSSVGSIFHLPISVGQELTETISAAREAGMQVLAADANGVSLYGGVDLAKPTLWVFGNEAWGIPSEVLELVDHVVSIPIYGQAESLNLATASAICLYASAQAQNT